MRSSDLAGRPVLILGTGREAVAVAEHLGRMPAELVAVDDTDGVSAVQFREQWGRVLIAPSPDEIIGHFDVAVKSPGISELHPLVAALRAASVPITSGTDLWMVENRATTTAVTGSKGKSTTASLIHHVSVQCGVDAVFGGNIGIPVLSLPKAERTVLELSSYQAQSLTVSPDIVVLTSLFPEHLDWHGSAEQYFIDKLNIAVHGPSQVLVNAEDALLVEWVHRQGIDYHPVGGEGRWAVRDDWIVCDGERMVPTSGLQLRGRHNAVNATLALAAVEASGVRLDASSARSALAGFSPLEHRLEPISDASGLTFVDDSLSTSPFATIAALRAFEGSAIVVLVGGQDRGVEYEPLAEHLREHPIVAVIGLPPSGPRILSVLERVDVPTQLAIDMVDAVARARLLAPAGAVVLLSPGAPSYGIYRDFAHRADAFRAAIEATST
jgi:UDP-N-acetylmuramoylalanine--D-glutamate ligase